MSERVGTGLKWVCGGALMLVLAIPLAGCGENDPDVFEDIGVQTSALTGTWTALTNAPPAFLDNCNLLTNGDVMCHQSGANAWHRLRPDIFGSYRNGVWNSPPITPMPNGNDPSFSCTNCTYAPLYFASAVLADGRVVVIGGEYVSGINRETNIGFIYDPVQNGWSAQLTSAFTGGNVGDTQGMVLQDGTFVNTNMNTGDMQALNATTGVFTARNSTGKLDINSEETWNILADGTILTVDSRVVNSFERYNPTSNTWGNSGSTSVNMADWGTGSGSSAEVGPCSFRPDNKLMCFSGNPTGKNSLYTPSSNSWLHSTSMDFPVSSGTNHFAVKDGPSASLPNGNVLVMASPVDTNGPVFNTPSHFYEVAMSTNTLAPVTDSPHAASFKSYQGRMLLLPTGEVLLTAYDQGSTQDVMLYSNGGTVASSSRPSITASPASIRVASSYTITGHLFNGWSLGANYGDDAQSATNYPLVRITNIASGHVFYARTFGHSRMGIEKTGDNTTSITTTFQVPTALENGASKIEVIANGIASTSVNVSTCGALGVGQRLTSGKFVTSCNGQYTLSMQSDGNLVNYLGSSAVWATGPTGAGSYVTMQPDGNLVMDNSSNAVVWSSGSLTAGSYLLLQDDGNLVVRSPLGTALWASIGGLSSGAELIRGGYTRSSDGRFALSMQGDGNLVLYFGSTALWATNTSTGAFAVMQPDGNFVLSNASHAAIWSSGTISAGASLAVQGDGNMVIYSASGPALWSTNTCCH